MATLDNTNVALLWQEGRSDKAALYALRYVTTGDAYDLSPDFKGPRVAAVVGTTVAGSEAAVLTGTIVTIPAGLSADAGYLLVWGVSA